MSIPIIKTKIEEEIASLQKKLGLLKEFPDLAECVNRWETAYLLSPSANAFCTKYHLKHSCGCCEDAVLQVSFYLERDGFKVYGSPVEISIGEHCYGATYGRDEEIYWEEFHKLKTMGFPDKLLSELEVYLKKVDVNCDDEF